MKQCNRVSCLFYYTSNSLWRGRRRTIKQLYRFGAKWKFYFALMFFSILYEHWLDAGILEKKLKTRARLVSQFIHFSINIRVPFLDFAVE